MVTSPNKPINLPPLSRIRDQFFIIINLYFDCFFFTFLTAFFINVINRNPSQKLFFLLNFDKENFCPLSPNFIYDVILAPKWPTFDHFLLKWITLTPLTKFLFNIEKHPKFTILSIFTPNDIFKQIRQLKHPFKVFWTKLTYDVILAPKCPGFHYFHLKWPILTLISLIKF